MAKRKDWWNRAGRTAEYVPKKKKLKTNTRAEIKKKDVSSKNISRKVFRVDELRRPGVSEKLPGQIYRFLSSENYAKDFVSGKILVSTLNICRSYENKARGDANEGRQTYHIDKSITGGSNDPWFLEALEGSGIHIGPGCSNITVSNHRSTTYLADAYVLCTTIGFSDEALLSDFGNYCVEIFDLVGFAEALDAAVRNKLGTSVGLVGEVTYASQIYKYGEAPPGVIGFVKEPGDYESQREMRFLWEAPNKKIDKEIIEVTGVSRFCRIHMATKTQN